eukprot:TRINITY_DN16547_c0_g1_i1.p1 TRINITY_DN16547_c0_g1~~TRINITY_DN16547_c0_g1_i1.p1  ORF type:complete len:182 (+),score=44.79 TRINITY_DN16547_c0_g1_i1:65-610(+)
MPPMEQPEPGPWSVGGVMVDMKQLSLSDMLGWRNASLTVMLLLTSVLGWYLVLVREHAVYGLLAQCFLAHVVMAACFKVIRGKDHYHQTHRHWSGELRKVFTPLSSAAAGVATSAELLFGCCTTQTSVRWLLLVTVLGEAGKCVGLGCFVLAAVALMFLPPAARSCCWGRVGEAQKMLEIR